MGRTAHGVVRPMAFNSPHGGGGFLGLVRGRMLAWRPDTFMRATRTIVRVRTPRCRIRHTL